MTPPHAVVVTTGEEMSSRVRLWALTLARTGMAVTVLLGCHAPTRSESRLGPVRVLRIPVPPGSPRPDHTAAGVPADAAPRQPWSASGRSWWTSLWPAGPAREGERARDLRAAIAPELERIGPVQLLQVHGAELLPLARAAHAGAAARGEALPVIYDVGPTPDAVGADSGREVKQLRRLEMRVLRSGVCALVAVTSETGRTRLAATRGVVPLVRVIPDCEQSEWPSVGEPAVRDAITAIGIRVMRPADRPRLTVSERLPLPPRTVTHPLLGMGPTNSAGQAAAWTGAARRRFGIATEVVAIRSGAYAYPADHVVTAQTFARDRDWQRETRERTLATWTHALLEAGRPLFGTLNGSDFRADAEEFADAGASVGLVFHGSEVRDPARHRDSHRHTPFPDPEDEYTALLQSKCNHLLPLIEDFDGPKFVSTLDLLDYVPDATWLPVTVDLSTLPPARSLATDGPPVVIHAPSNPTLKGTAAIEQVLLPLHEAGRIRYRRLQGLTPAEVTQVMADADIVVDQVLLGLYGHLACEAMALGRCVVGNVGDSLRRRSPAEVPILEADPDSLADRIEHLLVDRGLLVDAGARGAEFVRRFHSGETAAAALAGFLGRAEG